jgi:hypothetical protein
MLFHCHALPSGWLVLIHDDSGVCLLQIFRQLVVLLGSDSNVVHTYAAVAVERLLAQRVSSSELSSLLNRLQCCNSG